MVITKDLGAVSAYAYAVEQGYQGTEEEFAELMARQATVAEEAAASADAAAESASEAQASAEQAEQSAQSISGDVERAEQAATTATGKATEAATSATTANGAAQAATGKAAQAEQSATAAANSTSAAATSASNAAASATAAQTAKTAAETAQGKAEDAQAAAEAAAQSVSESAAQIAKNTDNIADQFSPTKPDGYAIGDYCIHEGTLYRFTSAHTGAWSASDVEATNVGDEVGDLKSALTAHEEFAREKIGAPAVSITDVSNYTLHEGAMSSGGTWNNVNSSFKYIVIPVPETGCKIQFTVAQDSERDSVVWCGATQYVDAVDGASYYADDVLSRRDSASANYDIPNDVKYILLNTVWGGKVITFSNFSISKAATKGSIEDEVDEINEKIIYHSRNLSNPADYVNGYIGYNGNINSPSDSYDTTGYIAISNGDKVAISPKIRRICVFDTSKTSIPEKFVDISDATDPYIFTASNDGYIRITFYITDIASFQVEYGDTVTSYEPYSAPVPVTEKVSELNDDVAELKGIVEKPGIKMLILGDSYSANEVRYIDYLQAHMNITSLVNLGVSSAHLKDIYADRTEYPYDGRPYNGGTGNNNTFGNQIAKLERLMTGTDLDAGETQIYTSASQYPDIILIEGGKNDEIDANTDDYEVEMWEKVNAYSYVSGGSVSLMNTYLPIPYADTDRTNFAGAMHYLYGALHTKFENAKIFFITPSGINYSNANHTLYMIKADQMRAAARYLCTPTIDWDLEGRLSYVDNRVLGSGTQEDPYTRDASSQYTVDSLHPNWKGGELLGAVVCAKLRMYGLIN